MVAVTDWDSPPRATKNAQNTTADERALIVTAA